ncbi:MAG: hypothetical protein ACREIT_11025, partial [Tepidisphaeraceae bacterium]
RWGLRYAATALLAVYFGLLAGFGYHVQVGFARAWEGEQAFWMSVIDLCPDVTDGTLVIFDGPPMPVDKFILVNGWSDHSVLKLIHHYPPEIKLRPAVASVGMFGGYPWQKMLMKRDGKWVWIPEFARCFGLEQRSVLPEGNLVLLREENGRLVRVEGMVDVQGEDFPLKPRTPGAVLAHPPAPLYRYLIEGAPTWRRM